MSKISNNLHHTRETYLYSLAFTFERSAYYGIRGLIVLYMIHNFQLTDMKAFSIYGLIGTGGLIAMIFGGLLGDLFLGNKRTLILGAILQFAGAFTLCFNSIFSLYLALGLFIIGSGLYSTNIKSLFGKIYLNKIQLVDSGFTIFQSSINLGAFLGTTLVVMLGQVNYIYGFSLAGLLFAFSALICYYAKENLLLLDQIKDQIKSLRTKPRLTYVLSAISIYTVFVILHDVSYQAWIDFQNIFRALGDMPSSMFIISAPNIVGFLIGIAFCIIWSYHYLDHFIKISIGFVLIGLTFILLPLHPDSITTNNIALILLCTLILYVGELMIWPSINSAVTKYANPKYLATVFSLVSVPSFLISGLATGLFYMGDEDSSTGIIIGSALSIIIAVLVILFRKKYKNNYLQQPV